MEPERIEELINAAIDGESTPADGSANRQSLAGEAGLESLEAAIRGQDGLLRAAFASRRAAGDAVAERVFASLAPPPTAAAGPSRAARLWGLLPILLSLAAGFLFAVVLFRPWEKSSHSTVVGPTPLAVATVAHLTVATGPVDVASLSQRIPFTCPAGGPIESGAAVSTGSQSRCELATTDGSAVRLDIDTKVNFEHSRTISMQQGQVWSCVAPGKEPFAVKSPQATVTANDGCFDLECKPSETVVRVAKGTAQVRDSAGQRTIAAGQEVRIRDGAVADERAVKDFILATRWLNDLLALKGPDNPELQERLERIFAEIGAAKIGYLYEQEIRAMGDASVSPLIYFLKRSTGDADQQRRVIAARLLADLAPPRTIPDLIGLLPDENAQVRFFIAQALTRLTGETQGRTPDAWRADPLPTCEPTHRDWQAWWQENKQRYAGGRLDESNRR